MNTVKLNIGGTVFQTTKATLTKFDGFFKAMFESGISLNTDESGCVFIDRDATSFNVVLNYLRDGTVPVPDDNYRKEQILKEAQFYMLDGLIHLCGGEPSEKWKRENFPFENRIVTELDEQNTFENACKRREIEYGLSISYDEKKYGDIRTKQTIIDFVKKHGDKWKILFYIGDCTLSSYNYIHGHQSSLFRCAIVANFGETELIEYFERLGELLVDRLEEYDVSDESVESDESDESGE